MFTPPNPDAALVAHGGGIGYVKLKKIPFGKATVLGVKQKIV